VKDSFGIDPRLPPVDLRQPLPWRVFPLRLALRFRSLTMSVTHIHNYKNGYGDQVTFTKCTHSVPSTWSWSENAHRYIQLGSIADFNLLSLLRIGVKLNIH